MASFSETTPTFNHEPLSNPSTQIRLLRVKPGRQDDNIDIELGTWDLQHAPKYFAISYTWGDLQERLVFINGRHFWVRQNCHYALWQVRIHHPGQYVWLDSICINQNDLLEKSHQVSIMKDIYVRASLVLASIGPHKNQSEFLTRALATMRARDCEITEATWDETSEDSLAKVRRDAWFSSLAFSQEDLSSLRTALTALIARSYWTRLWVVQEIAAANGRVQFLCGSNVLSWDDFYLVLYLSGQRSDFFGYPSALWTSPSRIPNTQHLDALQLAGLAYMDLDMALDVTILCECGDARDRVFGILPLVKWPQNDPGIAVDYNKSCFHVALESLKHLCQLETAFGVFNALDLSCFQPEMVALRVKERRETEVTKITDPHMMSATISADEEGTLKVSVAHRDLGTTTFAYTPEEVSSQVENICQESANPSQRPKTLMSTKGPVGFVCADVAPGDILLSISRMGDTFSLHLVVREAVENSYDVIGQAFFLPHFEILRYPHPVSTDISLEGTRLQRYVSSSICPLRISSILWARTKITADVM